MAKLVTPEQFRDELKRVLILKFRETMQLIYKGRLADPAKPFNMDRSELRLLVRVFAISWSESAAARGDAVYCHYWSINFAEVTMADWWPGSEWNFWE